MKCCDAILTPFYIASTPTFHNSDLGDMDNFRMDFKNFLNFGDIKQEDIVPFKKQNYEKLKAE